MADSGIGSRRQMEQFLIDERVTVNNRTATLGTRVIATDHIQVDGKSIVRTETPRRILLYYKPVGEIVTRENDDSNVFDQLPPISHARWISIGRLDVSSEGLLLFSTDGQWANQMMHPKQSVEREYRVRASGMIDEENLQAVCGRGVDIGDSRPLIARLFTQEHEGAGINSWYRIILTEGRHRAVRRLFDHYGLQVSRLLRIRYGSYQLPRDLLPGQWREVTAH